MNWFLKLFRRRHVFSLIRHLRFQSDKAFFGGH